MSKNIGSKAFFVVLSGLVILSLLYSTEYQVLGNTDTLDTGDMAWMIVSSAFVLLMTPGLAFFYGGMVNKKNVISTMLQSFVALGVISILWVLVGFSLAFGDSIGG
ncbi:MAG: ammonia channel protein, partial [Fulvivirga sp.]